MISAIGMSFALSAIQLMVWARKKNSVDLEKLIEGFKQDFDQKKVCSDDA